MYGLLRDSRPGFRLLTRAPGLAVFSAVAIALGIGSTKVMFTITHGLMREMLFDATPWDWKIYTLIALMLAATSLTASLAPALRAARVDPMETLRYE